jgi:hypothetical protein
VNAKLLAAKRRACDKIEKTSQRSPRSRTCWSPMLAKPREQSVVISTVFAQTQPLRPD